MQFRVLFIIIACFLTTGAMQQEVKKSAALTLIATNPTSASLRSKKSREMHPIESILITKILPSGGVNIINNSTGECIAASIESYLDPIVRFHPLGTFMVIGDKAGKFRFYDLFSNQQNIAIDFETSIVDLDFNKLGDYLAIAFAHAIKILDIKKEEVVKTLNHKTGSIKEAYFDGNGQVSIVEDTVLTTALAARL